MSHASGTNRLACLQLELGGELGLSQGQLILLHLQPLLRRGGRGSLRCSGDRLPEAGLVLHAWVKGNAGERLVNAVEFLAPAFLD
jgi:hypothetical protein